MRGVSGCCFCRCRPLRARGEECPPAALRFKVARDRGWENPRAPPRHRGGGRATCSAAQQSAHGSLGQSRIGVTVS